MIEEESQELLPKLSKLPSDVGVRVGVDGDSTSSRCPGRCRVIKIAAIITALAITVTTIAVLVVENESDDDKYEGDDHTYEVLARDNYHECLYYDDDTVYVADVCSTFDYKNCYSGNLTDSPCTDSYWCDLFCGTMCEEGMGAICYMKTLKNLSSTCTSVAEINSRRRLGVENNLQTALDSERWRSGGDTTSKDHVATGTNKQLMEMAEVVATTGAYSNTAMELKGHGLHDGGDEGCFIHSFCTYCTGFCRYNISSYVDETYMNYTGVSVYGFKDAVIDIEATCAAFGFET